MRRSFLATVVCGNAGAGKSTLGSRLAAAQGATLLDSDTCTERLVRLVMSGHGLDPDDRDSADYKALLREPVYETLYDIAHANLAHGPCVIVGPFTTERRCEDWPTRLEQRLEAPVEIVYVHCDEEERQRRLAARGEPRDIAKLAEWQRHAQQVADPRRPPFPHRWVDTSHGS